MTNAKTRTQLPLEVRAEQSVASPEANAKLPPQERTESVAEDLRLPRQCTDGRGAHLYRHGRSGTKEHMIWGAMKARCLNPANKDYPYYGGRGIGVCARWLVFQNFLEDMGEKPPGGTIERKNNALGYSPENCVWSTRKAQNRNTRQNVWVTINGETLCIADWCARFDVPAGLAYSRKHQGWDLIRAVTTPLNKKFRKHSSKPLTK